MSDAAIFVLVLGGIFVLRFILATVFFFCILPDGDRCINCDAPTLRVQHVFWHRFVPWLRPSWCYQCGWHGLLRTGPLTPVDTTVTPKPPSPPQSPSVKAKQRP